MNLTCIEKKGKLYVDEMTDPRMFVIDGQELTPLEVSQLAYYFALNWDLQESEKETGKG